MFILRLLHNHVTGLLASVGLPCLVLLLLWYDTGLMLHVKLLAMS